MAPVRKNVYTPSVAAAVPTPKKRADVSKIVELSTALVPSPQHRFTNPNNSKAVSPAASADGRRRANAFLPRKRTETALKSQRGTKPDVLEATCPAESDDVSHQLATLCISPGTMMGRCPSGAR